MTKKLLNKDIHIKFLEKYGKNKKVLIGLMGIIVICFIVVALGDTSSKLPINEQPTTQSTLSLEYLKQIGEINQYVVESLNCFEDIFTKKPNPILWTDGEITRIVASITLINLSYEMAKELDVPEKFQSQYDFFLLGLSKYAEAMPLLIDGIDNSDANKLNQVAILLSEGFEFIDQSAEELEKLRF